MRRVAGIDVGGTFTDLLLLETEGDHTAIRFAKVPTTVNQADGVLDALDAAKADAATLDLVIHGTTATTNAVLERKIAKVGLITTQGFRDSLELGRRTRPQAYGMTGTFEPLISREFRREVPERMDARGEVVAPLDTGAVRREILALKQAGCEALVIHFLHAYANPAHELAAGEIARSIWPNAYITLGHALLSEFREYERGTTASVNAAVQPVLDRYIARLQDGLKQRGFKRDLLVMNGNGGTVSARHVAAEAAKTVMSGPASGVMAASVTLKQAGLANAITYDMGGTSTDVALIHGGVPEVSAELTLAYGLPIHVPMVDVRTIGAGGGSIARVDRGGLLRVGPESAGANPGPIGYGRGGKLPTVTDANILLGRLDLPALRADPTLKPRIEAAFRTHLAEPLGIGVEAAAAGVITLVNTHMAGAIRMVSLSRGHDPRDFALFAFGGAGPLHAVALARELGLRGIVIPARPGLTNALGCLAADLRQDMVHTLNAPLDGLDMARVGETLHAQITHGLTLIGTEQSEIASTSIQHSADMQFRGQTHLIRVALPSANPTREEIQALFESAYFARFEVRLPEIRAVLVNLNTSVIGHRRPFPINGLLDPALRAATLTEARTGTRAMFADGAWHDAALYNREALPLGAEIHGPAILHQADATIVLEPGSRANADAMHLRIKVGAET